MKTPVTCYVKYTIIQLLSYSCTIMVSLGAGLPC